MVAKDTLTLLRRTPVANMLPTRKCFRPAPSPRKTHRRNERSQTTLVESMRRPQNQSRRRRVGSRASDDFVQKLPRVTEIHAIVVSIVTGKLLYIGLTYTSPHTAHVRCRPTTPSATTSRVGDSPPDRDDLSCGHDGKHIHHHNRSGPELQLPSRSEGQPMQTHRILHGSCSPRTSRSRVPTCSSVF